jgi:gas vesicle structural protein
MRQLIANTNDLISVLDRVLDKGIVVDPWARLTLQRPEVLNANSRIEVESSAVYVGYGKRGSWREDMGAEDLFPFLRGELWSA